MLVITVSILTIDSFFLPTKFIDSYPIVYERVVIYSYSHLYEINHFINQLKKE